MAKCPGCGHDVRTPVFLNLDAWSHLACPQCKAKLEMMPPRSVAMGPIMAPLSVLARRGPVFEAVAFFFMFATTSLLLVESLRPKLRLRKKPVPKPAIRLNIDGPSD